jgi:hypothetical protein
MEEQKELIKVKAIRKGYYGHSLRKEGAVFMMEKEIFHPAGKSPCKWVEPFEGYEIGDNGKIVEKKKSSKK